MQAKLIQTIFATVAVAALTAISAGARDVASLFDAALASEDAPGVITYKTAGDRDLHLHHFAPNGEAPALRSAVLWFHGGGWQAGSPDQLFPHCRYFSALGYVNLSVQYRLATDGDTIFDSIEDARDAFYWVQDNAESLGIDPERIVVAGESAGGHLAACIAYLADPRSEHATRRLPAAAILVNAVLDLSTLPWALTRPGLSPEDLPLARSVSPAFADFSGGPAALSLHGEEDTVVPAAQSQDLAGSLHSEGIPAKLRVWPGKSHAFFLYLPELGLTDKPTIHSSLLEIEAFLLAEKLGSSSISPSRFAPVHLFAGHDGFRSFSELEANGGRLYGNTYKGGHLDNGTVFQLDPITRHHSVLHSFSKTDGREIFTGFASDGSKLYGVGKFGGNFSDRGVLFEMGLDGSGFAVLHHFGETLQAGFYPHAAPVLIDGNLYGTTYHGGSSSWGGALYCYTLPAGPFEIIHSFTPATGRHPTGKLIPVGEWLYGTASDLFQHQGGHFGSLYRIHRSTHAFELLHRFTGGADGSHPYDDLYFDGTDTLIGTNMGEVFAPLSKGKIFSYTLSSGELGILHDFASNPGTGSKPNGALIDAAGDGFLYGVAHGSNGPGGDLGTLFRLKPDGSESTVLHTFDGGLNGNTPMRSLVYLDGALYGVTAFGGIGENPDQPESGAGMVFRYEISGLGAPEPTASGTHISFNDSGQAVVVFAAEPGTEYMIQRSTQLDEDWEDLGAATASPNGLVKLTDTQVPGIGRAFYRIRKND